MMYIADVLNKTSKIIYNLTKQKPILYASMAAQMYTHQDILVHDIDLLVSYQKFRRADYIKALTKLGFEYVQKEVLCFKFQGVEIELADLDLWQSKCGFELDFDDIDDDHMYHILSRADLIKLYTYLMYLEDRPIEKKSKDKTILSLLIK